MCLLVGFSAQLYKTFCNVTGFAGQGKRMGKKFILPKKAINPNARTIKIVFNSDIDKDLPWEFSPKERYINIKAGENALVFYKAKNLSHESIIGTATYNVVPPQAGFYFSKIDCFCFTEQLLKPKQEAELPVTFFVDPEIYKDPELKNIEEITLSYTFFRKKKS